MVILIRVNVRKDHRRDLSVNFALRGVQLLPLPLIVRPPSNWAHGFSLVSRTGVYLQVQNSQRSLATLSCKIVIFCMDIKSIEKCTLDSASRRPKTGVQALSSRSPLPRVHNDALHDRKTCSANVYQLLRTTIELLGVNSLINRIATVPRIAAALIPASPSSAIPIVLTP
jgi:hypothetical protein